MADAGERITEARQASGDELPSFLYDADEQVLLAVLENPHLTASHLCILLDRLDLPGTLLGAVAGHPSWKQNEAVRLRLARHPHTPRRVALEQLRQLFLFDLVQVALLPSAPAEIRRVAEEVVLQRLPHLPVGEKLTLARRGSARIAAGVLAEGHPQAAALALNNPLLNEAQILRVLTKTGVPERVVGAIARHPRWSREYNVRLALVRHPAAPPGEVVRFLADIPARDLRELCSADTMPPAMRARIEKELARRAADFSGARPED